MSPPRAALIDDGFAEFWQRYPRKRAKTNAWKAWKKIPLTPALFELIMMQLELQIRHDFNYRKKEMIPYPATWIRAESWRDEVEGIENDKDLFHKSAEALEARAVAIYKDYQRQMANWEASKAIHQHKFNCHQPYNACPYRQEQPLSIPTIDQIKHALAKMEEGE